MSSYSKLEERLGLCTRKQPKKPTEPTTGNGASPSGLDHTPRQRDIDATTVLGWMLDAGGRRLLGTLRPEVFHYPSHRVIFDEISALHAKGERHTDKDVIAALKLSGRLESAGGAEYVAKLARESGAVEATVETYVGRLLAAAEAPPSHGTAPQTNGAAATPAGGLPDWCTMLEKGPSGYLGDERNVLIAMRSAPELIGSVRFNAFSLQIEFQRAPPWRTLETGGIWTETDDTECTVWLQKAGLKVRGSAAVSSCIEVAARDHAYHPVRAHLESLSWDGKPRVRRWLREYLNASGNPEYLAAVGMRFLISAVARVLSPGCQADHMLVLEAAQGAGKTSAARLMAVCTEWFAGDLPDIHSKDARLQLVGRWIVEIAELRAVRSAQLEAQKSFLTQTHDTFRPPYGRRTAQFPRQCVFIGTSNETEYLRDRTGNRRYWPVRCGEHIDTDALACDRDQLWAEAMELYRNGEPWHLNQEEVKLARDQQEQRLQLTEVEEDVRAYLATCTGDEVTVREVLTHGLRLDQGLSTFAESARKLGVEVADALNRFGWRKIGREGGGIAKRTVYRRVRSGQDGQD
jgi:hypothetical protein